MDSDSKHVLTILGLVACFGAGYFVCKGENSETLALGERFGVVAEIENCLDDKKEIVSDNETAMVNAVNGYFQTDDSYFDFSRNNEETAETTDSSYEYINNYNIYDNIIYINSSNFFLEGIQGFSHYFRDYPTAECDGFIIDLRENIGGMTDYCMGTLGSFLEPQKVGAYHYYNGNTKELKVSGTKKTNGEKVVILVNENTKSAAEIFTAAMKQFYGDVTVLGTRTYGKGTFQELEILSDDEMFKYTAGTYTVGTWQCYDGVGISPDIEVAMDYEPEIICTDDDIQFRAALDLFK